MILVIAVATALSTYLSNVISLLVALMLYVGGMFREFIVSVIVNKNIGGGPLQSFFARGRPAGRRRARRSKRPIWCSTAAGCVLLQHDTSNLEQTTSPISSASSTRSSAGSMGRVFDLIPDVDRFDLTLFVSEGFDMSLGQLVVTLVAADRLPAAVGGAGVLPAQVARGRVQY